MIQLDDFTDTKWIKTNDGCKKLKSWIFKSPEYCFRGSCNFRLLLVFEDGTEGYIDDMGELGNCEGGVTGTGRPG